MTFRKTRHAVRWRVSIPLGVLLGFGPAGGWLCSVEAQSRHQVARSRNGMVVSAHPLATFAGLRILEQGGNAADAAAATGFAIAVVQPAMNSIGGRNQILIRSSDGRVYGIDGTTQVPRAYDPRTAPRASYGYATIGVPGALAGLLRLHSEHGALPLERVMAPAIEYAENGFRLLPEQESFHASAADQLAESEGGRLYYLKEDGSPRRAGELLRQPVLARTLRKIAAGGHDVFYNGEIAEAIVADMKANGGFVDRESLAEYRAEDARIVRGSYRGYDLIALDVPASGAIAIQALHIMEHFDRSGFSPEEWAAIAGQALGLAIPDLYALGSDTAATRATSRAWASRQAERVRLARRVEVELNRDAQALPLRGEEQGYTTHLSVADSSGMVVSLTQTLGPIMGSKVATPELGFLYAVTLGGYLGGAMQPGVRARSGITPLLVVKDDEPVLVLGAAGGLRIISAVVQAVSRVIDDSMSLPGALAAPRVHPEFDSTFVVDAMAMETSTEAGWSDEQVEALRVMGFEVRPQGRVGMFGRIHAIRFHAETGEWEGAADPDGEGTAGGPAGVSFRPRR